MRCRYDLVLFDLDGTLTDSARGINNGQCEAFRRVGWPVPNEKVLRTFIGPPFGNILRKTYPEMPEETIAKMIQYYREYYSRQGAYENSVYPGIFDLLSVLKESGTKLAVATSKPITQAKRVLDYFELSEWFEYISGESDSEYGGGKEMLILPVLEHFGIPASHAIMVGDTKYDAAGARKAGTEFVGVLYGFGTREEMEQESAVNFVESVPELGRFLIDKS
ncbi:MAG: 5'-nucleotidase [Oscillospiraceae bacterium]|jgi:phosphoglycolate phosphatase